MHLAFVPLLPLLNLIRRYEIPMQPHSKLHRQRYNRNRRQPKRSIQNNKIIPHLIKSINQPHQKPISLRSTTTPWNKNRFLHSTRWSRPPNLLGPRFPIEIAVTIEQSIGDSTTQGACFFGVEGFCRVVYTCEEMIVWFSHETVINSGEFADDGVFLEGFVGCFCGILR